jgi:DNA-directed RNA polymerase alpha subunit
MKTFESQLLELLREYENYEEKIKSYDFSFPNFAEWLFKRVEQEPSEIPFENTPLDSRIRNVLDNVNVITLDDLRRLSVVKLRNIQGLGEKGVKRCLELMTISL